MEEGRSPTISTELEGCSSKLLFLADCLQYSPTGKVVVSSHYALLEKLEICVSIVSHYCDGYSITWDLIFNAGGFPVW
jgi:hypothetical protein